MTDRYRIIARDRDGKELARSDPPQSPDEWFDKYSNAASLTIERLPPEEAEPRKLFVNFGAARVAGNPSAYWTKEQADLCATDGRTACVQFIEAKITDTQVKAAIRSYYPLDKSKADMAEYMSAMRAALAAAWGIEE